MQETLRKTTVTDQQLADIVETVFSAMLFPQLTPTSEEVALSARSLVASYVLIAGGWDGGALLLCSERFGRRAASIMLNVGQPDINLIDIHDAVAELANIIGGGIKSILPGPSTLSLPVVTHGSDYNTRIPRTEQLTRLEFNCEGEPVQLRLMRALHGC